MKKSKAFLSVMFLVVQRLIKKKQRIKLLVFSYINFVL